MKLHCVYCKEGQIDESDLPCTCPKCGHKLTRVISGFSEELMAQEDAVVLDLLDRWAKGKV